MTDTPDVRAEIVLNIVDHIYICDACIDGKGGECHTPGCILWIKSAPDISIREQLLECGGTITPVSALPLPEVEQPAQSEPQPSGRTARNYADVIQSKLDRDPQLQERVDRECEIATLEMEIAALREQNAAIGELLNSKPWNVIGFTAKLIEAANILLHEKDYDGHGHEAIIEAKRAATEFIADYAAHQLKYASKKEEHPHAK
jgi:hypothetical protein